MRLVDSAVARCWFSMPSLSILSHRPAALLYFGAEGLVRGSASLALRLGLTPLVVELTVVTMGTSIPEVLVGVKAALQNQVDIALGNVVGANIFNILGILGVASLEVPLSAPEDQPV